MVQLAACVLLTLASAPVAAQDITSADRAAIEQRIGAFDAMMRAGRAGDSLEFVPPRLLATIARKSGMSAAEVKASLAKQAAAAIKDVTFVSFGMTLSAATTGVTPDNSRHYLLIPTETVIEIPGSGRLLSKTTTLALKERAQWYLVRIDGAAQIVLLREAYPEFAGVAFPTGSTTPVK